jgi:ABC-type bacteriocin/lantibiotic exporter with double-glycine peptidase domain
MLRKTVGAVLLAAFLIASANAAGGDGKPQVNILKKNRVTNRGGNCGYCAAETVALHYGHEGLRGFADRNRGRAAGGHEGLKQILLDCNLDFVAIRDNTYSAFVRRHVRAGRPVIVHGENHIVVVVGWHDDKVQVIENARRGGAVLKRWSHSTFRKWWSGRAYAVMPPKMRKER